MPVYQRWQHFEIYRTIKSAAGHWFNGIFLPISGFRQIPAKSPVY
jgi:hypothetical protein